MRCCKGIVFQVKHGRERRDKVLDIHLFATDRGEYQFNKLLVGIRTSHASVATCIEVLLR